jgi:tetratricopeptide (TPR) repeat protein
VAEPCPSEDALLALADGTIADGAREAVLAHLDGCDPCRQTAARLATAGAAGNAPALVGRYRLLEPLGVGAMGVVFAAHDPELDRRVAVKLLRREDGVDGGRTEARLVSEARALARLAHPNVIAAYEVGRHDDEVFLAMELVDGGTLTAWLARAPRSRRAIVAMFAQAGAGLVAAHEAGIVHRDFKPDNVLVGTDGRARVTDFGLASGGLAGAGGPRPVGAIALTRTGALAGTPAYMAPEQLAGGAASERSDQYAFAVALWSALYGVRPFDGSTVPALLAAARARAPRTTPGRDVPAGLRTALERALAADPAARWPSVRALLAAIAPFARPPALRRRLALAAAMTAVAVAAAVIALAVGRSGGGPTCAADPGPWDADARAAVARAFAAASPARGAAVAAAVDAALTRFDGLWTRARQQACTAGDAGDSRASCLALQGYRVAALVRLFRAADAAIVEDALVAVARLPDPASCAQAGTAPVAGLGVATRERALAIRLEAVAADFVAGRHLAAFTGATAVRDQAQALGLPRVEIAARLRLASARLWTGGALDAAADEFQAAIDRAAATADDRRLIEGLIGLTDVLVRIGRNDEAATAARLARALLVRAGGDAELEAGLAIALCMRAWRIGKELDRGRQQCEEAERAVLAVGGPDDYRLAELDKEAGNVAHLQGRYDDAIALYERSLARGERLYGPGNRRLDSSLGNLAETLVRAGRPVEALPRYRALIARRGDSAPAFHDGYALALARVGDHDAALAAYRETARVAVHMGLRTDECWGEIGAAEQLLALGRLREATAQLARAEPRCERAGTPVDRARCAFARARLRAASGDDGGAREALAATRDALAEAGGGAGPAADVAAEVEAWAARR